MLTLSMILVKNRNTVLYSEINSHSEEYLNQYYEEPSHQYFGNPYDTNQIHYIEEQPNQYYGETLSEYNTKTYTNHTKPNNVYQYSEDQFPPYNTNRISQ